MQLLRSCIDGLRHSKPVFRSSRRACKQCSACIHLVSSGGRSEIQPQGMNEQEAMAPRQASAERNGTADLEHPRLTFGARTPALWATPSQVACASHMHWPGVVDLTSAHTSQALGLVLEVTFRVRCELRAGDLRQARDSVIRILSAILPSRPMASLSPSRSSPEWLKLMR